MSAGLPGLGLGGLFFILSALVAPLVELMRTLRGRSSRRAWAGVGRQFALAVTMIVAVDLTLRGVYRALGASGLGEAPSSGGATVLPLAPIGITAGLLAVVLASAKAMQLASRVRSEGLPLAISWPSRPRALAGAGAVLAAWFALLMVGASQLSTLSSGRAAEGSPPDGQIASLGPVGVAGTAGTSERTAIAGSHPRGARSAANQLHDAGGANSNSGSSPDAPTSQGPGTVGSPADTAGNSGSGAESPQPDAPPSGAGQPPDSGSGGPGQSSAGSGPPEQAGPPEGTGPPDHANASEGARPPEDAGPPPDPGPPEDHGIPAHAVAAGLTGSNPSHGLRN